MGNIVLQVQKNNNTPVPSGNNMIFDQIISFDGNISYDFLTGEITIMENGLYLVDWYVVTQSATGATNVSFKLVSDQGHGFASNTPYITGNMTGLAILPVANAPLRLQLENTSNAIVYFSHSVPSKSNLRVIQLDNLIPDNARCFALDQFSHVLEQIVNLSPGTEVSIFASRLPVTSGSMQAVYKAPDAGNVSMLIIGDPPTAININTITALYFPNFAYDESITYLDPPDPFPQNCDTDLIKNIYNYVSVGDNISVTGGINTSASGDVHINEYGIIVFADGESSIFLYTPNLFSITVNEPADGLLRQKSKSIMISG